MKIVLAIPLLTILVTFSLCQAGQAEGPPIPLKLPEDVDWVNTILIKKKDGSSDYQRHGFIARGKKWRLETERFNKPTIVFVFDGNSLGSNYNFRQSKNPEEKSPQFWDPRTNVKMLYELIKKSDYKGFDKINNKNCWHFLAEEDGLRFNLWVDVGKMIPRKFFLESSDGYSVRELYDDLSEETKINSRLFDVKNLEVHLLNK